jgi:hypothetical protein
MKIDLRVRKKEGKFHQKCSLFDFLDPFCNVDPSHTFKLKGHVEFIQPKMETCKRDAIVCYAKKFNF